MIPCALIVGSPRSGTTIVEEVLGRHPDVAHWYEPYFVWDALLGPGADDHRTADDLDERNLRYIRGEFERFLRKSKRSLVVEKSPEHALRLPFARAVLPEAKIIHMVRDGRDATMSIRREWERRAAIVREKSLGRMLGLARDMVGRQPYSRNKRQAVWHELRSRLGGGSMFNKAKWRGHAGWGPRIEGWEAMLETVPSLAFNAMQWARSVEQVIADTTDMRSDQLLELRYEEFTADPVTSMLAVCAFLAIDPAPVDAIDLSDIRPDNSAKWIEGLTADEKKLILPHVQPTLERLGYASDGSWAEG